MHNRYNFQTNGRSLNNHSGEQVIFPTRKSPIDDPLVATLLKRAIWTVDDFLDVGWLNVSPQHLFNGMNRKQQLCHRNIISQRDKLVNN
jgi:hypothetical protein